MQFAELKKKLEQIRQQTPPAETQVREAMARSGIYPVPDELIADGQIHRFPTGQERASGPNSGRGYYVVRDLGPVWAGMFGDWHIHDRPVTFVSDSGRDLTPDEKLAVELHHEQLLKGLEEEARRQRDEAAKRAEKEWKNSTPAKNDHPYLSRKGVEPWGLHVGACNELIVPVFVEERLTSLQTIYPDGAKRFLSGGAIKGGYYFLDRRDTGPIYICEGFATAASVRQALNAGGTVLCAFSAGNLEAVGRWLRGSDSFAGRPLVFVADNDASGKGEQSAKKAAEATGGRVVMPPVQGDANDYAQAGGDLSALLQSADRPPWLVAEAEFTARSAPIQWLIKKYIQRGGLHMVFGPSGSGKTFLVLDWVMRIAGGAGKWDGHKVTPGPVVYLAGEGHAGLKARITAWKRDHEVDKRLNLWISRSGTDLDKPEGLAQVVSEIEELGIKPACIVVDTLHRFLSGDENKAQDTRAMLKSCAHLQERYGASVLLVHHTGVGESAKSRARGSSSWRGALEMEFLATPETDKEGNALSPARFTLIQTKAKDGQPLQPQTYVIDPYPLPDWTDEDGDATVSAVLRPLRRWQHIQVAEAEDDGPSQPYLSAIDGPRLEETALNALKALDRGRGAELEEWRDEFYSMAGKTGKGSTWRSRFKRARDSLIGQGKVTERLGLFFVKR